MKAMKLLLGLALVAIVAVPVVEATCIPAKQFSTFTGAGGLTAFPLPADTCFAPLGPGCTTYGRLWDTVDPTTNNFGGAAGLPSGTPIATCSAVSPPTGWWLVNPSAQIGAVNGFLNGNGCTGISGCPGLPAPGGDLLIVIEDSGSAADSYLTMINVDQVAAGFDFTVLAAGFPYQKYPRPRVLTSQRGVSEITVDWRYPNVDGNFTGATAPNSGTPLQADDRITNYVLYRKTGAAPTTRDIASGGWVEVDRAPAYVSGQDGSKADFVVPCGTTDPEFYALGFEFQGVVDSLLVGAWTEMECDPTMAEPRQRIKPRTRKPADRTKQ